MLGSQHVNNSAVSSRKSCSIGPRAVVSWFIQTGLGRFLGPLEASKSSLAPIVGESIDGPENQKVRKVGVILGVTVTITSMYSLLLLFAQEFMRLDHLLYAWHVMSLPEHPT